MLYNSFLHNTSIEKASVKGSDKLFGGTSDTALHEIVTPSSYGDAVNTSLLSVVNVPSGRDSFN